MRTIVLTLILLNAIYATEILKWRGETLTLDVSVRNTTHIIFDEEIASDIHPKEENINIIRNGKDIYFRYNPFNKYKIIKSKDKVQKIKEGVTYKGNPVKVWFIGKKTGTSYALNLKPVETPEDTFYIRNETVNIGTKITQALDEPRTAKITLLAKQAAKNEPISGFTITSHSKIVKNSPNYNVRLVKTYKGLIYDVDVYQVIAKKRVILDEFRFINLPKQRKAFIGLVDGWEKSLARGKHAKVVIVSEK